MISVNPVELLAERLRTLDPDRPHSYAAEHYSRVSQSGPWFTPREVIEAMLASDGPHHGYGPAVVGARLIGSLGYAAAGRLGIAIATTGQAYDVSPDSLMLRLDEDGLVEQIAVRSGRFAVLPDDPLVGAPGVEVVEDLAALVVWAAQGAHATLAPLIEQIHTSIRYGTVAMWNQVADSVLGPTTKSPLPAGGSQEAGRAAGQLFLDALVAQGAPIRRRGTVRIAENGAGQPILDPVRGMCCLFYRQGEEKCGSCPLVKS
ncbi:(2Fe-2S)-binding protein [Kineosporia sp. NBRC 101731]|uniref:(2Fe-2S)-binding protein n=1 Tax=Kineosporia sp. NBRC 101731 TaxID=3032199 RepID=UPI0024A56D39|nr:(2Fe-2S)-binding protein [Kineosporia sp. NBRC 101731]GLY26949.1 hypothetical protein Kisp02_03140 [Kineosporia sp. NBRC 101731]